MKQSQQATDNLRDDIREMISRREQAMAGDTLTNEERTQYRRELADLYEALRGTEGR